MSFKDILVHLDASARSGVRLDIAADIARRHAAHLTALWTIDLPSSSLFYGDPSAPIDPSMVDEIIGRMRDDAAARAAPVKESFSERLRRDGIEGEWRLAEGAAARTVALQARCADLAVIGQPDPDEKTLIGAASIPATVLLSSGRPVLIVPYAGTFGAVGGTVLVAWKSSREAARAVHDAIPLLRQARSVTVLAVNPAEGSDGDGDIPAADVANHLARHGISATADHSVAEDVPEGDVLLNYADDIGADLLVAGGYGHSRLREFAFGGVTRTLLTEMTLPVLLSH